MSLAKGSHPIDSASRSPFLPGDGEGLPIRGEALGHIPSGRLRRRSEGPRRDSAFSTLPALSSSFLSPIPEKLPGRFLQVPGALSASGLRTPPGFFAGPLRWSSRALCWRIPGSAAVGLNTCPVPRPVHLVAAAQPTPRPLAGYAFAATPLSLKMTPGAFLVSPPPNRNSRSHSRSQRSLIVPTGWRE